MDLNMKINNLIDDIINKQKDNFKKTKDFCCGVLTDEDVYVFENDILEFKFKTNGECEVVRKNNDNPVLMRNNNKQIYRLNGEWIYLKISLYELAGYDTLELMNNNFNYDMKKESN